MTTADLAQDQPLTCETCRHAEAARLVVADWVTGLSPGRRTRIECEECAGYSVRASAGFTTHVRLWVYGLELLQMTTATTGVDSR